MPNSETAQSSFPTNASAGGNSGSMSTGGNSAGAMAMDANTVQRLAHRAHEAVDKLEQTVSTSSDKMMGWQQEYGDMARDQVRTSPLAALGVAFAAGIVFSKLFMR